jgi:hypothetical protein
MKIRRVTTKGLVISRLPAGQLRLLREIVAHADPAGSPAAIERLAQSPVREPQDDVEDGIVADWHQHVIPDLQTEFSRQLDVVAGDLKNVRRQKPDKGGGEDGEHYEFTIPFDHVESWYGALNQARLVMQERYRFPEIESVEAVVEMFQSENIKPYLTSRFYVELQAALLDLAMDRP